METLVANFSGSVRKARLHGRDFLVAPLVLVVPGVLNGSRGPLLYPEEELSKYPAGWDSMPIVLDHPTDNGQRISARHPSVLEKQGMGFVFSSRYNKKLAAEAWFDELQTKLVSPSVYKSISSGESIEVSTGLFTDNEPAPEGATYNGVAYSYIARNYRPDHLAVLPDSIGACSRRDGCGVMVNSRSSSWSLLEPVWNELTNNPKGKWKPPPSGNAPKALKKILREVYSKFRDAHPAEDKATKTRGARIAWAAVKKAGWRKGPDGKWEKKMAKNSSSSRNRHDKNGVTKVDNYDKSMSDLYDDICCSMRDRFGYEAYVVDVYDSYFIYRRGEEYYRLGYSVTDGEVTVSEDKSVEVVRRTSYEPIENSLRGECWVPKTQKEGDMGLNKQQRDSIIEDLVTNCDCWKHSGDRELLGNFSDDKLLQLKERAQKEKQAIAVANAAVEGFTDNDGNAYRINPETGKWEHRKVEKEEPEEKPRKKSREGERVGNEGQTPRERPTRVDPPRQKRAPAAGSLEDWLRNAPQEVRNTFQYAQQIEQREKETIIAKLLINVSEVDRPAQRERLLRRSLDDLNNDLALVPKITTSEDISPRRRKSTSTAIQNVVDEDMLALPKMDWKEVSGQEKTTANVQTSNSREEEDEIEGDEEWLKNAPVALRNRFMNAMQIEQRERERLIEEILTNANMTDEDQERRLQNRLQNKSLDELRDLLALSPPKEKPKAPSYFGSATTTVQNIQNNPSDDVLPLPKMDWKQMGND